MKQIFMNTSQTLATSFVVKYALNAEGIKEPGCEKPGTRHAIHLTELANIPTCTSLSQVQHYCREILTTVTVISGLDIRKSK